MLSETLAAPGTSVRLEVGTYRPRLQRFHRVWMGESPSYN